MPFMQTESVLQTKNRSGLAKNRFFVALLRMFAGYNYLFKLFLTSFFPSTPKVL